MSDPDVARPSGFTDATALPAIRAGVIGDFANMYDDQILYSGLLGDEWFHSGTFPTRTEVDIRAIQSDNATLDGVTRGMYRARSSALDAATKFADLGPDQAGYAEVLNLEGFTYVLFGENYCSGVPFSHLNEDGSFDFGEPETTTQMLNRATTTADAAIAAAQGAGSETQENLARVLKGRALLDLGQYQDAAAAVASVPSDFSYVMQHSENTGRENNGVYQFNHLSERWSVANNEGGNGLDYRDADDPRVPWTRSPANDRGFDNSTPQYDQLLMPDRSAPSTVATGTEARLIEAEAAYQAGDAAGMLDILNTLREDAGMDDLTDPGTASGRVDMLFRERAFWLWLQSHRLGDMRRLIRQYGRSADEVFPVGPYHKATQGGVYGSDVNLPLYADEKNNPNVTQLCLDRNA